MNIEELCFNEDVTNSIMSLALKVELKSEIRYRATRKIEDLVGLVSLAQKSQDTDVRSSYQEFISQLSSPQHDFFLSLGIDTLRLSSDQITYRGNVSNLPRPHSHDELSNSKKRKLVYRGSEKWV